MNNHAVAGVDTEIVAQILEREIAKRPEHGKIVSQFGFYASSLADEIAASGLMHRDTASRRINEILSRRTRVVSISLVDKILCALDLNHLWHAEIDASVVHEGGLGGCSGCGCAYNTKTPGCIRCSNRFSLRKKRESTRLEEAA